MNMYEVKAEAKKCYMQFSCFNPQMFISVSKIYQFNQNSWHFLFLAWKFPRVLLLGTMCAQRYFLQKNGFLVSCLSHIKFVEVPKPSRVLHLVLCIGLDCELDHGKIHKTAAFFLKDMRKLGECSPLWLVGVIAEKWEMELCYPPQPEGDKPQSLCLQTVFELLTREFSGIDHTSKDPFCTAGVNQPCPLCFINIQFWQADGLAPRRLPCMVGNTGLGALSEEETVSPPPSF